MILFGVETRLALLAVVVFAIGCTMRASGGVGPATRAAGDGDEVRRFTAAPGGLAEIRGLIEPWAPRLDAAVADEAFRADVEKALDIAHGHLLREAQALGRIRPALVDQQKPILGAAGVDLPRTAPCLVVEGVTRADHRRAWRAQLALNMVALTDLTSGAYDRQKRRVGWPQWNRDRIAFYAALNTRCALVEVLKLVRLLRVPAADAAAKPGDVLMSETFDDPDVVRTGWEAFGPGTVRVVDGALEIDARRGGNPNTMVWPKKALPADYVLEMDFAPLTPGALLLAVSAVPKVDDQQDYSASTGPTMNDYNLGFDAYHYSMHRGTNTCHMRRVGTGLFMLAQEQEDPCDATGGKYHLKVVKRDRLIVLLVDGKMAHSYVDVGAYGPVLAGGRFGIRHFGPPLRARYDNIVVRGIVGIP